MSAVRSYAQLRHDIAKRVFDLGLDAYQASVAAGGEVVPARTKVQVQLVLTVPALAWLGRTTEQATLGDRMLRRVVYTYLVTVVAAAVVALVGLREGLW